MWVMARVLRRRAAAIALCFLLANCASSEKFARAVDPKYGVTSSPRVVDAGQPVPKGGGTYRVGKPYTIAGRDYTPETNEDYTAEGMASWYGDDFHGRLTANGEVFDMNALSAAHPTLPMPSYVRVTNLVEQEIHHRAGQRPRPLSRQSRHRPVAQDRRSARLQGQWRGARARRLCRARLARRLRRPQADGDLAPGRAGAGAVGGARRIGQAVCRSRRQQCRCPARRRAGAVRSGLTRSGRIRRRRWPTAGLRPTCPRPASSRAASPTCRRLCRPMPRTARAPAAFVSGRGLY